MDIWVVVAESCEGCNSLGVKVFDHAPSETEANLAAEVIGGMWCITTSQVKCEINGDAQKVEHGS